MLSLDQTAEPLGATRGFAVLRSCKAAGRGNVAPNLSRSSTWVIYLLLGNIPIRLVSTHSAYSAPPPYINPFSSASMMHMYNLSPGFEIYINATY